MQISSADAILRGLAKEGRRVLVPWRAVVILRNATMTIPAENRRWSQVPTDERDVAAPIRTLRQRGDLSVLMTRPAAWQVTAPFAPSTPPHPYELLLELNPYGAISHASALSFHHLSLDVPEVITAMTPATGKADLLPVGTEESDWEGVPRPAGHAASHVMATPVIWRKTPIEQVFGIGTYHLGSVTISVTTPERTLVEGLRAPDWCGGIANVLASWARARWTLDVDAVIATTDRFDTGILRQRVGYVLEALGVTHPELDRWRRGAKRGGSSKLVAADPFAPEFSERWSLSLNGPIDLLDDPA